VTPGTATDGSGVSLEQQQAELAGFSVDLVNTAQWQAMTAAQFSAYQVLILGDPNCDAAIGNFPYGADANASTWQGVVASSSGNRVLIGTDPTLHNDGPTGTQRGDLLEKNGIAFAGAKSRATGAYIDLSCAYDAAAFGTAVPFLDGLSSHGAGSFTVGGENGVSPRLCAGAISIVAQSGPTTGLHNADLSGWGCSVHEFFDKFPSDFTPLAIATDPAIPKTYSAKDVDTGTIVSGSPYIMLAGGGVTVVSNITLTPATATNPVGTSHTVTATVKRNGNPVSGAVVTFNVDSGPNVNKHGTGTTNASGQTTFTYTDTGGAGTDEISATFTDDAGALEKATATKTWVSGQVPTCVLSGVVAGPPKQLQITVQDTGSGLASVTATTHNNATVSVPSFTSGTKTAVVVTATKTNQTLPSQVALQVKNVNGGTTNCDPLLATLHNGTTASATLDAAEHYVLVTNGSLGLAAVTVSANGHAIVVNLEGASRRLVDIGAAMHSGANTVTVTGGTGGGSADALVWDGSGTP
jgi:hypothetical protein